MPRMASRLCSARESDPRIERDPLARDAARFREPQALLQEGAHVLSDVPVLPGGVERVRGAQRMHEHQTRLRARDDLRERGVHPKPAHVVHHRHPRLQGTPSDLGVVGIDGEGKTQASGRRRGRRRRREHGLKPLPFLLGSDRGPSGTRALRPQVHRVRALRSHRLQTRDGRLPCEIAAAVVEGIRCEIENADHAGAPGQIPGAAAVFEDHAIPGLSLGLMRGACDSRAGRSSAGCAAPLWS